MVGWASKQIGRSKTRERSGDVSIYQRLRDRCMLSTALSATPSGGRWTASVHSVHWHSSRQNVVRDSNLYLPGGLIIYL